jgi:O-antigen/teichoic acid export membrane protein
MDRAFRLSPTWRSIASSTLAKDTLWVVAGQALRLGIQVVYFVVIARALGAHDYGLYVGVLAIVAIAAPFASLGSGNLLIKHVARDAASFPPQWGRALATTLVTGTLLLALVVAGARLWLPSSVPWQLVMVVGGADLVFVRLVDVSAQAYQAHRRLARTALLQLLLSPLRLLFALGLAAATPSPTALQWGWFYLLSALLGAVGAVMLVNRELGAPRFLTQQLGSELREGAYFAGTLSAQSATNDIDKAMLVRLASLEATGIYAAAYRMVDMAFLPVGSLLVATYSHFFRHGVQGLEATARYARSLLGIAACYGVLSGALLYFLAPVLPLILGTEYQQAVSAVQWLATLPLLKTVHYLGANALTGAGYQGVRTTIMVAIAATNVLLNLWLIPTYSWRGAAIATIASDSLLAIAIWTTVCYLGRSPRRVERADAPSVAKTGW